MSSLTEEPTSEYVNELMMNHRRYCQIDSNELYDSRFNNEFV
ncbi:hypothetical protein [Oceanobacillus chungangensis]|nr:hypothetical protein [Oceanobacillus chungangensis]